MKWPQSLTLVRHGESEFNALKTAKAADPLYRRFLECFNRDAQTFCYCPGNNSWSVATQKLALKVWDKYRLPFGDHDTPLTHRGCWQAEQTGIRLPELTARPDVIFISPHLRTRQTYADVVKSWPELGKVLCHHDDRIREQEHGLATVYNDWRLLHVFHPEQRALYLLDGKLNYHYPQGESSLNVWSRGRDFSDKIIRDVRDHGYQHILVFTHHLTILSLRSIFEGWTHERFIEMDEAEKPVNCGVTIYRGDPDLGADGRLVLDRYNVKLY